MSLEKEIEIVLEALSKEKENEAGSVLQLHKYDQIKNILINMKDSLSNERHQKVDELTLNGMAYFIVDSWPFDHFLSSKILILKDQYLKLFR